MTTAGINQVARTPRRRKSGRRRERTAAAAGQRGKTRNCRRRHTVPLDRSAERRRVRRCREVGTRRGDGREPSGA
ncbi:Hypp9600 [Branchiostoma lanceolatum]|uniref:Hypp9600 protein n=1 Tax=Branchiostoma lanceolatum TaxID=7740 RepID=A0A8S4MP69_BRALA|nr:Hypp9600 [Branchiostoma lanceolatum]